MQRRGFSVRPRAVSSVKTKPGIKRCALSWQSVLLRRSCCSASVNAFTPALATLYAGSPGGVVIPWLGAGIDDKTWTPTVDHAGNESLRPVDNAPEIDAEHALPIFGRPEHVAARLHASIVHKDIDATKPLADGRFQLTDIVQAADIGGTGHDVACTARARSVRTSAARASRSSPRSAIQIRKPLADELFCSSEAYAGSTSCDDSNRISGQGGMRHMMAPGCKLLRVHEITP